MHLLSLAFLSLVQTFVLGCEHLVPDSVGLGVLAWVDRLLCLGWEGSKQLV